MTEHVFILIITERKVIMIISSPAPDLSGSGLRVGAKVEGSTVVEGAAKDNYYSSQG